MTTSKQVAFFLHCDPRPAPRPRAVARGKHASIYHPVDYTKWKEALTEQIKEIVPTDPAEGPLTVFLRVNCTRPRTSKLNHPAPDVDNYAKGVLDALTQSECVWKDDKQVVRLVITKAWCDLASPDPGFDVVIRPHDPNRDDWLSSISL